MIRLLHTADWHLGHTLNSFERSYEHEQFLLWLLNQLTIQEIDLLLIAGDLFDKAHPSPQAAELLYRFLAQAKQNQPNLHIVLITGNHDAPNRMEALIPLLAPMGITLVGRVTRSNDRTADLQRLVLPLHQVDGAVGAWLLTIPFVRPTDLPPGEATDYDAGVTQLYQQTLALALEQRQPHQPILALGHGHLAGGERSEESERPLLLGGLEALSHTLLDERLAYVALGHLHRPQRVGQRENVRYAGSPIPLSFAERHYPHQVVQVELGAHGVEKIQPLRVPITVPLLRLPDSAPLPLEQVLAQLTALELPDHGGDTRLWPYLEVRVLLEKPAPGLRSEVEQRVQGKPVRLAQIQVIRQPVAGEPSPLVTPGDLSRLQPLELFRRLYAEHYADPPAAPLLQSFGELLAQAELESPP